MTAGTAPMILIVANRTASTSALLAEVHRRAPTCGDLGLIVPPESGKHAEDWSLDGA